MNLTELYLKHIQEEVTTPQTNPQTQRIITNGLAIASLAIPLPGLTLAVNHISNINSYKCRVRCEKNRQQNQNSTLCYKKCKLAGIDYSIKWIEEEIKNCGSTGNSRKCQKKLFKLLLNYRTKKTKSEIELNFYKKKIAYDRRK